MKILCSAAVFFFSGWQGLSAQQNLPSKRVKFEVGKTTASEATKKFISQNKIQQFMYSDDLLKKYVVRETKCMDNTIIECLTKLFQGLPIEALIDEETLIIREKKFKSTLLDTEVSSISLAKQDTIERNPAINKIEEIVVNAGYYKVSDKDRTGSIAKVSAKGIENQPVTNVLSTVQGRMTGVNIVQNSGAPGGGYDIQIRGRNSLRNITNSQIDGNQPLYIIDGIPIGDKITSLYSTSIFSARSISPLNSINPNDIESIEILKDADATSIYGARGANGVVLVTTKKGKKGKIALNINSYYSLSNAVSNLKMMSTEEYLKMRQQAYINDGITNYPATAYDLNGAWDKERYTDWRKVLIGKTATQSSTQLSLSGGSETTTFMVSFGHNEQTTVFGDNFKYMGNSLNTNLSHRSADKKFQIEVTNVFSVLKNNLIRQDLTSQAYFLPPNSPALYNENGEVNWQNSTFTNPLASYNSTYSYENKQYITSLNTQYELFKNFRLKLNTGLNYQDFQEIALQPNTMYDPNFALGQTSATSRASQSSQNKFSFIIEPQANWLYSKENHELNILLGATFQQETGRQNSMIGIGFQSNALIENIGAAQTKIISDIIKTEYRYAAIFGRINYQFEKKYFVNITGRRDGSSRFGPNHKFANFGAIGTAWLFSKEEFLKPLNWLSFGKLRASIGTTGSDNIGDYQYFDTYTVSSQIYNGVTGLIPSRLYNPNYSWEKTTKLEAALELGFLNNRINLNTAWYRNRSSNQLIGIQLPRLSGFSSVLANLPATVENQGWEIELNVRPFKKHNFSWETGFNISFPKNKLLSFPGLEGSSYANQYVIGQSTSIVKVYHLEGVDPLTGQYKFKDYNGDGKISSPDDNKVIENIGVRYFGGWNNSIQYKNWNLSFLFQFVKQKNWNYNSIMSIPGSMSNQPVQVLDVWSPQNPMGTYMPYRSSNNATHNLFQNSDAAISDASFIRLKNVQLSYNIPLKNSIFNNVKIYFQGQNLLTFTKYFGIDPEFLGLGFLPPLRTYSIGAQFNL